MATFEVKAITGDMLPESIKISEVMEGRSYPGPVFMGTPGEAAAYLQGRFDLMVEKSAYHLVEFTEISPEAVAS